MLRRVSVLVLFMVAAMGCAESSPKPTPTPIPPAAIASPLPTERCIETVVIQGGKFTPDRLTVPRNCVVLFSNRDDSVEQIIGPDFLLGEMGKDQSWAHTYKEPGTFPFRSTKTQTLVGTITVR